MGEGVYLDVSLASHPKTALFQRPLIFLGSRVFLYLHPLVQNDEIRHGNTYGDGSVFKSAMPLHLHKCVMRFVSDS